MRRNSVVQACAFTVLTGVALFAPTASASAVSSAPLSPPAASAPVATAQKQAPSAGSTARETPGSPLKSGERVVLDAKATSAKVFDKTGKTVATLTPDRPGPVTSKISGRTYKLFIPANKPDQNPPRLTITYHNTTEDTLYFPQESKKMVDSGNGSKEREVPRGAVRAGAEGVSDNASVSPVAVGVAGGVAAIGAAGIGIGLRRRHNNEHFQRGH